MLCLWSPQWKQLVRSCEGKVPSLAASEGKLPGALGPCQWASIAVPVPKECGYQWRQGPVTRGGNFWRSEGRCQLGGGGEGALGHWPLPMSKHCGPTANGPALQS